MFSSALAQKAVASVSATEKEKAPTRRRGKTVSAPTAPRPTEDDEQAIVIRYCAENGIEVAHIANEGKRSVVYGARMKRLGLRKGFPDLFFPYARNGYHGLFIEMKRDEKAKPTHDQTWWSEYLNKQGYRAVICHGSNAAIEEINSYFLHGN